MKRIRTNVVWVAMSLLGNGFAMLAAGRLRRSEYCTGMKRLGAMTMLLLVALSASTRAALPPVPVMTDVFVAHQDGHYMYRIPAIETTPDGAILAFAEGRKENDRDPLEGKVTIDLVSKRSTDNGRTWSAMTVIEASSTNCSVADPTTVVDRQTGNMWLLYGRCKPGRTADPLRPGVEDVRLFARVSSDSGKTWSAPIDLAAATRDKKDSRPGAHMVGPGGMIQDRQGRLVVGMWRDLWGTYAIYSEDHGATWHRGQMAPMVPDQHGNENQLVELSDGRLLMDYRQDNDGGPNRWMTESRDGGRTWSEPRRGLMATPCHCAIHRYTLKSAGDDCDRIIWTGPQGPGRHNLVVRVSFDEGRSFPFERLIAKGSAMYSDLTVLKDRSVGVLWERDNVRCITFTRLPREFLVPK
jgi:sialidase-1